MATARAGTPQSTLSPWTNWLVNRLQAHTFAVVLHWRQNGASLHLGSSGWGHGQGFCFTRRQADGPEGPLSCAWMSAHVAVAVERTSESLLDRPDDTARA